MYHFHYFNYYSDLQISRLVFRKLGGDSEVATPDSEKVSNAEIISLDEVSQSYFGVSKKFGAWQIYKGVLENFASASPEKIAGLDDLNAQSILDAARKDKHDLLTIAYEEYKTGMSSANEVQKPLVEERYRNRVAEINAEYNSKDNVPEAELKEKGFKRLKDL